MGTVEKIFPDRYSRGMNIRRSAILLLAFFSSWLICLSPVWAETIHTVKKGETIYAIAKQYGISYKELIEYNKIQDASKILVGQKIKIPDRVSNPGTSPKTTGTPAQTYKVKKGDTLFGIAKTFSVPMDAIRRANGLTESSVLKEGALLQIPGSPEPSKASPTTAGTTSAGTKNKQELPEVRPVKEVAQNNKIQWPVPAKTISYLTGKLYGVVITADSEAMVRSLSSGTVVSAGPYRGFGKVAIIQSVNGYLYVYGGCESLSVSEGEAVRPGTILGRIGIDSLSKQAQLYFLVYKDNKAIDPVQAPRE